MLYICVETNEKKLITWLIDCYHVNLVKMKGLIMKGLVLILAIQAQIKDSYSPGNTILSV